MANEMIDRVAAALFPQSMASTDNSSKRYARSQARLAIEAMREPTEYMIMTGCQMEPYGVRASWQVMVDGALE